MRYFTAVLILTLAFLFQSCATSQIRPELDYQDKALSIDGEFAIDGLTVPLIIELAAAEYGANGRMLSRNALVTVGEGSILKGVNFEAAGGKLYVSSGDLRIPIEDEETVGRIMDILSLFSVREDCYYSTEDDGNGQVVVYRDGENSVTVRLSADGMPTKITAAVDGHELMADIRSISVK